MHRPPLQILLPSGETAYTRAGNFSTNDQGQIVTEDGYQNLSAASPRTPDAGEAWIAGASQA